MLLLLCVLLITSSKADIDSSMLKGSELYRANKFQSAIEEYNSLVSKGYQGVSLYYNLGNAHYRLGNIGYAILYYEKALKISPDDEDVRHNLTLAKVNLKDKVDTLPPFFIFNIWESLLAAFSVSGWTIVAYVLFLLVLTALVSYFFSRRISQQRFSFFSGITLLVMLIICIAILTVRMNKEFNIKYGIIVKPTVIVKSSPDESSKDEFKIHEGLKVLLEDKVENWVKIRLDDGKLGWIPEKMIGII